MTIQSGEALSARPSRNRSGLWVVCRENGEAVQHPRKRLAADGQQTGYESASYFGTEAEALAAIPEWRETADELSIERAPKPTGRMGPVMATRTLQEEMKALRSWQKKRDANPLHGWHVCSGSHCMCKPAPQAFRNPSPELLAMQAGKPAYGNR